MKAFAVQYLSRSLLSPRLINGDGYRPLRLPNREELSSSVTFEYDSEPHKYTFAHPWPQSPSIGAIEFVDPYQDVRWPALVNLTASIAITNPREQSIEFVHRTLVALRNVLWASFQTIGSLQKASDQLLTGGGYRRAYFTNTIDINGNPIPSRKWHLAEAAPKEPRGPGFVHLDECVIDNNCHCLVWSQAISFPNRTSLSHDQEKIKQRIRKVKCHWSAYKEIQEAERFADSGNVKAAVRFAAPAVEASIRSYADLWGVKFPANGKLSFIQKIEKVLKDAGRTSFQAINPQSSNLLLRLYLARSSMHLADCSYTDPDTKKLVIVDAPMAREFVIEAKIFLLWLDTLA